MAYDAQALAGSARATKHSNIIPCQHPSMAQKRTKSSGELQAKPEHIRKLKRTMEQKGKSFSSAKEMFKYPEK